METCPIFTATTRAANVLTTTQSEVPTSANGWALASGIASAAAGSNTGPFGFGVGVTVTSAASGTREYTFNGLAALTAAGVTVSCFIRRGTLDLLRFGLLNTTAVVAATVDSQWNTAKGAYVTATPLAGAVGGVVDAEFDNSWQRVSVSVVPGWNGNAWTIGNALSILVQPQGLSKTVDIWGVAAEVNLSQSFNGTGSQTVFDVTSFGLRENDQVLAKVDGVIVGEVQISNISRTGLRATFLRAPAAGTSNVLFIRVPYAAKPYLTGLGRFRSLNANEQSLPVFRPSEYSEDSIVGPSIVRVGIGTSTGTVAIQVRSSPAHPWITRTTVTEASTGASANTYVEPISATTRVDAWPEMRLLPTALGTGTVLNGEISA